MQNVTTASSNNWRQEWRNFVDRVTPGSDYGQKGTEPERQPSRKKGFRGFGSPQGKF